MFKKCILFLILCGVVEGVTYYVDADAEDGGNGTTTALTGVNAAWNQISDITGLAAADIVKFNCGDTWREKLMITADGNSSEFITFTSYGTGDAPLITAADEVTNWTLLPGATNIDGWESGEEGDFYYSTEGSIVTWGLPEPDAPIGGGVYGKKFTPGEGSQIQTNSTTIWFDLKARVGTDNNAERTRIFSIAYNADGGVTDDIIRARFEGYGLSRELTVYNEVTDNTLSTGTTFLSGGWVHIRVHFEQGVANNDGVLQLWANGTLVIDTSDQNFGALINPASFLQLGHEDSGGYSNALYIDNFMWHTADFGPVACYRASCTADRYPGLTGYSILLDNGVSKRIAEANVIYVDSTDEWYLEEDHNRVYYVASSAPTNIEVTVRDMCISALGSDAIKIENLHLRGSYSQALSLIHSDGSWIKNVGISGSGYTGIAAHGDITALLIEDCNICNCEHAGITVNDASYIPSGINIYNNYIHDCYRQGIAVESRSGNVSIIGNVIEDISKDENVFPIAWGIQYEETQPDHSLLNIISNTIYNCEERCVGLNGFTGFIRMSNNIFHAGEGAYALVFANSVTNRLSVDYNTYWAAGSNLIYYSGSLYNKSNYAAYQSNSGLDENSLFADPQFMNAANSDFRLKVSSPCLNTGKPILGGIFSGYNGTTSIGAYQSTSITPPDIWDIIEWWLTDNEEFDLNGDAIVNFEDFAITAGGSW